MFEKKFEIFFAIVRIGIGKGSIRSIAPDLASVHIDWPDIKKLADDQGLTAVVLDGLNAIHDSGVMKNSMSLPLEMKLEWIGEVLQNYEQRYVAYEKAIGTLAGFYNEHGYKMMVIKGFACSLDWPKPEHRPCGDIDIWQFGQWKEADAVLSKEKGVKVDGSHHHHTVFSWQDFSVENHYDFVNVHHHKSNADMEMIFKELGQDDSHFVELNDVSTGSTTKVYLPSPDLHALFLLRHAMAHFAATELTLRQLLDWAFFVEKHTKEVDWAWLETVLEKYGMYELYRVFNAICVDDMGFSSNMFPAIQFLPELKDKVVKEILDPAIPNVKPKSIFKRVPWKWRRWKSNEWKHKLVYTESMWEAFWSGVWNHLLKPSSI